MPHIPPPAQAARITSFRRGGVQGVGDGLGDFLETSGEIQLAAEPGAVKPAVDLHDLAAQGGDLGGQRG